jgi:uncharacterized protein
MAERDINSLADSQFAFIEPGGTRDTTGNTAPRSKRHFPLNDEAATRRSITQASQSPFGKQAMPAIMSAARKYGIAIDGELRARLGDLIEQPETSGFPERRFTRFPLEIRTVNDHGPKHIYGYAACFRKLSRRLGGFVEQVGERAFNESKTAGYPDVVCRYNHHDDQLLGTTHARTLTLAIDDTGLVYDVEPPNARADVLEYVTRGDVRHSSFAFRVFPGGDEWGVSEFNYPMRTLHSVQLVDVAPVLDPAYPDATAGARAMAGAVDSLANWVQADPDEVRSRLHDGRVMEFFKRTDIDGGKPATKRAAPKRTMLSGQQALLALQANYEDPWADQE